MRRFWASCLVTLGFLTLTRATLEPKNLGCFLDSEHDRDIDEVHELDLRFDTFRQCHLLCKGWRYMALQFSYQCFCGNSFGKHGSCEGERCPECGGGCRKVCEGSTMLCGGGSANSIYELAHFSGKYSEHSVHPGQLLEQSLVLTMSIAEWVDEPSEVHEMKPCVAETIATSVRLQMWAPSGRPTPRLASS
ncbi:hypothetical protein PAPYR_13442 [Paratrimastix pyriformis]|uniref:WSC domain-containing protein n=1 Tax=Paratrimastix pyriformis TaxID=342808 RepID=A0ABQ8U561_9EUKA|nr:hypothetical protein PAPYR_13442 [Paratrimastix pyriformis]